MIHEAIRSIRHGVIVSSQASPGEPLCAPEHILAMALSGLQGGAVGIRLEGAENISFARSRTTSVIIGLIKSSSVPDREKLDRVYITASVADVRAVADAGADVIALDATARERPDGSTLTTCIREAQRLGKPVWADISTLEEGRRAAREGADVVSTTLFGYTRGTQRAEEHPPDFGLLGALVAELDCPVVLEGRIWHPEEVTRAFQLGAHAVVIGSAITRPQLITRRFVKAVPELLPGSSGL